MQPGRELDALVAEKVMGLTIEKWMIIPPKPSGTYLVSRDPFKVAEIPSYSTNISVAWEVVEKLNNLGFIININSRDGMNSVEMEAPLGASWVERFVMATDGSSVSNAICLAALKITGWKPEEN